MNIHMKRPSLAIAICISLTAALSAAAEPDLKAQLAAASAAGDTQSVTEILRRLHAAEPGDVRYLKELAAGEFAVGNTDAARVLIAELEQAVPASDPRLLELRGDLLLRENKTPAAVEAWQASLAEDGESVSVLSKLAWHYLNTEKNAAGARVYFDRLVTLRSDVNDHIQVAKVAAAMRDWTVVIERTATLKRDFSTNDSAKLAIVAFERLIDASAKISELDAREKSEPNPLPIIVERSRRFLDLGLPDLALADARRALTIAPEALHVRLLYAAAALRLNTEYERIAAWQINAYEYRRLSPSAAFLEKLASFDQRLFDAPDDVAALAERMEYLLVNKQTKLAEADARHVLQQAPDHPQALRIVALGLAADGYFARAVEMIDRAVTAAPEDATVLDAASSIHERQGHYEQVIDLCDRWLKAGGDSKTARSRRQTAVENLQKSAAAQN